MVLSLVHFLEKTWPKQSKKLDCDDAYLTCVNAVAPDWAYTYP